MTDCRERDQCHFGESTEVTASPLKSLPGPLRPFAEGRTWTQITIGMSPAETFRLDGAGQPPVYLKVSPVWHRRDLLQEKERIEWLRGRLPVPEVFAYETDCRNEYLVLSALPGRDAASLGGGSPDDSLVRLLAVGLRSIHALRIEECPFDMSLDRMLQEADRNVADGIVDEADFDDERGRSAAELFEELMLRSRPEEDLVFTHGDYCLPNVIIDGEEVSGFVDWGRAGVADRYKDIALVVRSLEYNTGRDLRAMFFEAYGLPSPDADKIEYYKLLDDFF